MPRSTPEQIEFRYDEWEPVLARITELAGARHGWINLYPEATEHQDPEIEPGSPSLLASMFKSRASLVPMGTWVAATDKDPASVGLSHGLRQKVAPRLREAGVFAPDGWKLVQDNPRRGLVVQLPEPTTSDEVLHWLMSAIDALSPVGITGHWLAEIHV